MRGLLDRDFARKLLGWEHSGFSIESGTPHIVRAPLSLQRIHWDEQQDSVTWSPSPSGYFKGEQSDTPAALCYARRMKRQRARVRWWKLAAVWAGFLLLHFSYETFPGTVFRILAEDHEATFFHMKMLFIAYIAVSLVELAVRGRRLRSVATFAASRALISVLYPWAAITMWFTAEALGLKIPLIPWEIVYANVFTAIGIYLALRLEEALDGVDFRPALQWTIALLFVTAVLSYVAFSVNVPVHFFTTPPE
jgi:hypothetical protein